MNLNPDTNSALYRLLPAIYRIRDEEQGRVLEALLAVITEQLAVMEENIEQLYDDQFIETCAAWAVPYLGDLIGYRPLYSKRLDIKSGRARAEVAHTVALRRRKGTAAMLEQLAHDVTGWNARAVEFFQTLATTQYMNHIRLHNHYAPDLRHWEPLEYIASAFDTVLHTVDVRRIASGRGRHNIPNVGIFLWPVEACAATRSPAVRVDARRWRVSPLNHDMPLYNHPESEEHITHIAERPNVPMPLSRRVLDQDMKKAQDMKAAPPIYYGKELSLAVFINGRKEPEPATKICVCNLSDEGTGWAHLPAKEIAIDPVLGRIALPAVLPPEESPITRVEVTHYYGFSAKMGGGEYDREASFVASSEQKLLLVPAEYPTIQDALKALEELDDTEGRDGVVLVTDNGRYEETLTAHVKAGRRIELRSANGQRPSLVLTGEFTITGEADSEFVLNGLLISGGKLHVPAGEDNRLAHLRILHSTLVPGWALTPAGQPTDPGPSVVVEIADTVLTLVRTIVGALRVHRDSSVVGEDLIIDATDIDGVAFAAPAQASAGTPPDEVLAGASLSLSGCTTIGKLHARTMPLISNCLLLAGPEESDGTATVRAEQKQAGCVRFSWLPPSARVPRRYHCLPQDNAQDKSYALPRMLSLRYGTPTYCRLSTVSNEAVRHGADDEGEMGAFHHLHEPQRETNLRLRLAEYLRAGLEAGVFFEV